MSQWVKVSDTKPEDLRSVTVTHVVKEKHLLLQVVLSPPHVCMCTHTATKKLNHSKEKMHMIHGSDKGKIQFECLR